LLAVAAAEQEDEPLRVGAQVLEAVSGVTGELFQGDGQPGGVAVQPLAEELQHSGEFGDVGDVELDFGHGVTAFGGGGVGLEAVDFTAGGAGHRDDVFAVDDQPEGVVLGDDGDDLSCVGHADLEALAGDLDAAAGGDPPLDGDGGFGEIQPGHRVLDVATGIGEPALAAAGLVGPGGHVTGTACPRP